MAKKKQRTIQDVTDEYLFGIRRKKNMSTYEERAYIHKFDRAVELLEEAKSHVEEAAKLYWEASGKLADTSMFETIAEDLDDLAADIKG